MNDNMNRPTNKRICDVALITLLALLLGLPPLIIYAEETDLAPEAWKIKGVLAAFKDPNPGVQARALEKLGRLKSLHLIKKDQIPKILNLLKAKDLGGQNCGSQGAGDDGRGRKRSDSSNRGLLERQ